jgi:uncharacterized protein YabN with tetrapyrrole methylase and pyrophosphatase domain
MSKNKNFQEIENLLRKIKEECPECNSNTFDFYKKDLIDEAIEVRMAVDKKDWPELKEELGDVLWSWMDFCLQAEKEGLFTMEEVIEFLKHKLVQRNPHVFGDQKANTLEEARNAKKKAKEEWKQKRQ